jgi:hypothetical protein
MWERSVSDMTASATAQRIFAAAFVVRVEMGILGKRASSSWISLAES